MCLFIYLFIYFVQIGDQSKNKTDLNGIKTSAKTDVNARVPLTELVNLTLSV